MSGHTSGPREYRGFTIWPPARNGMWTATNYSGGYGQLAADTLQGLKGLITDTLKDGK